MREDYNQDLEFRVIYSIYFEFRVNILVLSKRFVFILNAKNIY